ncbi:hypothetical protein ILUMI_26999 [Ignelater luminosus]|uniref:Uncharacterized protein n=1 Tax=Ignelater luminosus TaxID=2038154 RepID=A0A8K0C3V9_IGNLU|nr:hypothetical protein ILUMI_26999 [Ignelater luminosus]
MRPLYKRCFVAFVVDLRPISKLPRFRSQELVESPEVIISEENTLAWEGNFDLATGLPISEVPNIPDLFDRPQKDEDMGSSRISVEYTTPEKKDTPSEKDNPAQENSLVKDVKLEEIRPFPKHKQTDKVKVRQSQKS